MSSAGLRTRDIRVELLLLTFTAALFSSALLMFLIQPLIGKVLLPKLGGTPQVWNTCMVFFQAILFAGYLYAHFSVAALGIRRQALLHLALAAIALVALPVGGAIPSEPDADWPVLWLMQTLLVSVGAPMFVISATAPVLQKWFAHTHHPAALDPYFLYAASNLGSLVALLGYPTLVEPFIDLGHQRWWWSAGFTLLVMILALCAVLLRRNYQASPASREEDATTPGRETIAPRQRLQWLLLSFAPSSLLLGVTTYITTDIAAVPLFWIVPLALYLLTFILVFARKPPIGQGIAVRAQALLVTLLAVMMLLPAIGRSWLMFAAHLMAFFITALVCHGELVRRRPAARHLTEFYLWLSLGGVLGGVFNALLAPVVFTQPIEYPLILALACLLRPADGLHGERLKWTDVALPLALFAAIFGVLHGLGLMADAAPAWRLAVVAVLMTGVGLCLLKFSERPVRFGLGIAAILTCAALPVALDAFGGALGRTEHVSRSFFGVYKVSRYERLDLNLFMHGTTIHGTQSRNPALSLKPGSYYHADSPFADLFRRLADKLQQRPVAIVGLGAGGLACYGNKGSPWTYYEIDPLVERIARDTRLFTYLRDCPPQVQVVIGDARLTLRHAADRGFALILVDAFTSDAIPIHLLTREAVAGYFDKLAPDGVLALHISNNYLDLAPVVGSLASDAGLVGRINAETKSGETDAMLASPARLALLARREADLGAMATDPNWKALPTRAGDRVWSDDYVNILSVLWRFE